MKHRTAASTLTLVLAALVGCSDTTAIQPVAVPDEGLAAKQATTASRILYYDFQNIWIMNDDGTDATALAAVADVAFDPSWAPDGKRILFNAYKGEAEASIYSMNPDGSAVTRITRPPAGHVDIRPTRFGKGVAFVRQSSSGDQIYRVNLDGTGETLLASGVEPSASPSGDRLAYVNNGDIYEYQVATGQSINVTNTPAIRERDPAYSPNGKQIAFGAGATGIDGIYVMRGDGTAVTRITSSGVVQYARPKWSPDGKRIAFNSGGGGVDILVMNADGSGITNLTAMNGRIGVITAWAR